MIESPTNISFTHTHLKKKKKIKIEVAERVKGNRQEGQGSPNRGNSLQVSDIFISLKQQEETD